MTLKTIIVEQEFNNTIFDLFLESIKQNLNLTEGIDPIDQFCRNPAKDPSKPEDVTKLVISTNDNDILAAALPKLKDGMWNSLVSKNKCFDAIVKKLAGEAQVKAGANCDVTIDNPKVAQAAKDAVLTTLETEWTTLTAKVNTALSKGDLSGDKVLKFLDQSFKKNAESIKQNLAA